MKDAKTDGLNVLEGQRMALTDKGWAIIAAVEAGLIQLDNQEDSDHFERFWELFETRFGQSSHM